MPVQAWTWWQQLMLVMAGGALGAAARFWLGGLLLRQFGSGFPWGTFAVNMIGGLLMGLVAGWLAQRGQAGDDVRLFAAVGVLGGFTTFSAFSLDAVGLWEQGEAARAALYVGLSLGLSIVALIAGATLARSVA